METKMSDEIKADIENVELARAIASLMAEFHARGQRIRDLEEKLQAHKRSLESFHCVDEVSLDDGMGAFRCEQKKDYSRQHMMRHAAERIGRQMLEEGYIDFEEVVRLDREYIERWSLWLDVKILLLTMPAVIRRTGAY